LKWYGSNQVRSYTSASASRRSTTLTVLMTPRQSIELLMFRLGRMFNLSHSKYNSKIPMLLKNNSIIIHIDENTLMKY
jgi:hypothetical protein